MLHGDEFGWRDSKLRPCLLIEVYENHPIAAVRPRTTTGRDGEDPLSASAPPRASLQD